MDLSTVTEPFKIRCIMNYPDVGTEILEAGETYQVRVKIETTVYVDKSGGGIHSVPVKQFDNHFKIVVQVTCTNDYTDKETDNKPQFGTNGSYWAVPGEKGKYDVFLTKSIKSLSFSAKRFERHFKLIS